MTNLSFLDPIEDDLRRVETLLGEHPPEEHEASGRWLYPLIE